LCLQRNIHSYIYAPNYDFVQSPKRAGHSYPTDQDLWAKTVSGYHTNTHLPLLMFSNTSTLDWIEIYLWTHEVTV